MQALPQAKSVRISLEWLDRMMNAVGELVINRTRMLGRLTELQKLVEVLQFSKARLTLREPILQIFNIENNLVTGSLACETLQLRFSGASV